MEIFKEEESLFSDLRTIIRRIGRVLLFRFFLKALKLYFPPTPYFPTIVVCLPRNCGVPSPQLRGNFPSIVGKQIDAKKKHQVEKQEEFSVRKKLWAVSNCR